jgi:hypothetical protein
VKRYYFAYHLVNDKAFAFMWVEEGGMPIGGRPDYVPGTMVEITEEIFNIGELKPLELEHPFKGLPEPTPDTEL